MKKDKDIREKRGIDKKVPVKVGRIILIRENKLRPSWSKFPISNPSTPLRASFQFLIFKLLNKSKIKMIKTKLKKLNSIMETKY